MRTCAVPAGVSSRYAQLLLATSVALFVAYVLVSRLDILAGSTAEEEPASVAVSAPKWDETYLNEFNNSDVELLRKLGVHSRFDYRHHCVRARTGEHHDRQLLIQGEEGYIPKIKATPYQLPERPGAHDRYIPECQSHFSLEAPINTTYHDVDTRTLLLGVATSLGRVESAFQSFARWLSYARTPLVIVLNDQYDLKEIADTLSSLTKAAEKLHFEVSFEIYKGKPDDSEGLKNFALAAAMHEHARAETQWFGVIDDDTFFLSLPKVLARLSAFDVSRPHYIGAVTEVHARLGKDGYMAYGGAGIFLSRPLFTDVATSPVCAAMDRRFGDVLWRDCIFEITSPTITLTELPGLHQLDLSDDLSGWYEGPHLPDLLTIHHWKSWHHFPVPEAHLVADVTGSEGFLQRYSLPLPQPLKDQSSAAVVFTNGYSIVEYPEGLPDLNLMELTNSPNAFFDLPADPRQFHHSLGRTRPKMQEGKEKISWVLKHARIETAEGGTRVRQWYVQKEPSRKEGEEEVVDEFNPLVSIIEVEWQKG